jgi:thiol-disulfide isomerase/thioredoxin
MEKFNGHSLIQEIMNLTKSYDKMRKTMESTDLLSFILQMRTVHGRALLKLHNVKIKLSSITDIGSQELYDLSVYQTMVDSSSHLISEIENDIQNKIKSTSNVEKNNYSLDKPTLINFYAGWCKYSKDFMKTWDKLENIIKKDKINLLKIECSKKKEECKKFNITSFPSIKLFYNGIIYDFEKERSIKNIIEFIKEKIEQPNSPLMLKPVVSEDNKKQKTDSSEIEQPSSPLMLNHMAPVVSEDNISKYLSNKNNKKQKTDSSEIEQPSSPLMLNHMAPVVSEDNITEYLSNKYKVLSKANDKQNF